jgi:dipeptidyl aminopeptidase/acylaminoacyl peptidase
MAEAEHWGARVHFWSDGLRLAGTFAAAGTPGRRPAIVCVHGYTGRLETYMPPFVRELTARGWHTLDFWHRGFGESEGVRNRVDPHSQVHDILAALVHVRQRNDVDPARVAILGLSHGGGAAIKATAIDTDVACLATVGAPGSGERWMRSKRTEDEWRELQALLAKDRIARAGGGESQRVPYEEMAPPGPAERAAFRTMYRPEDAYPEGYPLENIDLACGFRAEDWITDITPRPVLLIHGGADTMVRHAEAEALFERAGEPKRLVTIPDINHAEVYEARNPDVFCQVANTLCDWYARWLD